MTVWGIRVLASLAGTRSASSLPFHCKTWLIVITLKLKKTLMRNMSSPEESVAPTILSGSRRRSNPRGLSSPGQKTIWFVKHTLFVLDSVNRPNNHYHLNLGSLCVHGVERNGPSQPLNMVKPFTYFLRLLGSGRVQRPCLALVVSWPPSAALKSRILHQIVHIFTA